MGCGATGFRGRRDWRILPRMREAIAALAKDAPTMAAATLRTLPV